MTLEVGNRGRGSGPRGGGRGVGGDRGGGRGVSRGFRGGDVRGRGGRGRGDRGGRGFSRGGDRGSFRGGERGSFRGGERGSFRGGERGSFRGGDRGSFRGTFRGGNRGAPARGGFMGGKRDFNGSSVVRSKSKIPVCHEVAHALQLRICYKSDIPTEEELLKQLPGFHSRFQKSPDSADYFLLFKDIESLEAAKTNLEEDDTVTSVDYMGLRAERYLPESLENRQVFLQFYSEQEDEEAVKKIDDKIVSVKFMKSKSSCLAEFPTVEEANDFIKKTALSKNRGDLKYCAESTAMQTSNIAKASIQPNQIVVRDVPKKATLKELALLFPDANSVTLYNQTFPSSDYCHAAFRFENVDRVNAILTEKTEDEILGKKVYIAPAYSCLLTDMPKLGEPWTGDKLITESPKAKGSKESPKKKIKLEKDVNGGDEEDEDEDEENEDEEEEDEEEEDEEEGEGEGEDEENEENDDEEDEDDDEGEDENGKDDNEEEMESAADEDDEEEESDD
ncbi:U3 small nucleolar RNA-associated protein 25 [Daphnia magna]|uniref:U3 small nucleolar RNA-associated protein 25 n=1 Tax=Daphnia magna TaxID=35525 RepID=UPI001E1BAC1F|nr:U3 small nucleolar RNA-associated protein 25 [Daphnia magna]